MIKDELLSLLFREFTGKSPDSLTVLPKSGSDRIYCRMKKDDFSVLGVWNPSRKENDAFTGFAASFNDIGLRVPRVYKYLPEEMVYLTEDLGDTDLYTWVNEIRKRGINNTEIISMYRDILRELTRFQFEADKVIDYELSHPRKRFDRNSVIWDLNYFKYMFLRLSGSGFNEQLLEEDFQHLSDQIEGVSMTGFLYRDFQSRNIMIKGGIPWFIDFQGGRKGAPYYDLASLLLDPYIELERDIHDELLGFYLSILPVQEGLTKEQMLREYKIFGIVRLLQALGAYGFRGLYERKPNFTESIPAAVRQLARLFGTRETEESFPELARIVKSLHNKWSTAGKSSLTRTTVIIESFSFRKGIPETFISEGGYLFDCRLLTDPSETGNLGLLSGKDREVSDFLENKHDIQAMIENAYRIINGSLQSPGIAGVSALRVSFGGVSGRHRSVYCAEKLAEMLRGHAAAEVVIFHNEIR